MAKCPKALLQFSLRATQNVLLVVLIPLADAAQGAVQVTIGAGDKLIHFSSHDPEVGLEKVVPLLDGWFHVPRPGMGGSSADSPVEDPSGFGKISGVRHRVGSIPLLSFHA